jgi:putative DNA primase/helicase
LSFPRTEIGKAKIAIVAAETTPDLLAPGFHDDGNARRLIALHGHELRYCHDFKKWLIYDGRRWALDTTGRARQLAKQTMVEFHNQATMVRDAKEAETFARKSLNDKAITNLLSMAQSDIFVVPEQLDQDIWALNFLNGTVDLRTGKLRPHNSGDFITKLIHCDYNPGAGCPLFLGFLARIMGASPDASEDELDRAERMSAYLQKAFGYSLTGDTSEKVVFFCHGNGNNGKTTVLSLFLRLAREYSVLLQIDSLTVQRESNNSQADLADLRGARFASTSETEEGQRLAEGKLKRITQGMGMIKSVRKYENPITFPETHKLWFDANHKPIIKGTDNAIWNRLHLIPFTVTIPKDEIDETLPAKLVAEAEGVLAWAVAGAVRWHAEGLGKPSEVEAASKQYRQEMDQLSRFVDERCLLLPSARIQARQLYQAYRSWAEAIGEHPMPEVSFSTRMVERDHEKVKTETGRFYQGIALRSDRNPDGP